MMKYPISIEQQQMFYNFSRRHPMIEDLTLNLAGIMREDLDDILPRLKTLRCAPDCLKSLCKPLSGGKSLL